MQPRRFLVYGVTGSGKTTFAERLSDATGIPWHSVDDLTWLPGWVPVEDEVQRERFEAICRGEEWILDTAYAKWVDVPLERAELIVGLDYPRWLSLGRLLRRTFMRMVDRKPICNGNVETLATTFNRESILLWHFRSFARKRARMRRWEAEGRPIVRLTSPREAERWLLGVTADGRPRPSG